MLIHYLILFISYTSHFFYLSSHFALWFLHILVLQKFSGDHYHRKDYLMMKNEQLIQVNIHFQVFLFIKNLKKFIWNSLYLKGHSDESHQSGPINSSSSLMHPTKSANLIVQENRQKAAKMLISVVIIFVICYIPVHAFNLFR